MSSPQPHDDAITTGAAGGSAPSCGYPRPYYQRDGITIYHGDCREILPSIDASVMVTDPPFGIAFASGQDGPYKRKQIANDESTDARDEVLLAWGDRPALVFGSWRFPVYHARQAMVWDKGMASGMGDLSIPWKPNWELIFVVGSGFSGKRTTGVITGHTVVTWASKGRCHPNMKPTSLMCSLLAKCPPGAVVDPFMGSGTTLVAARAEGRQAIGIEIEERYCEIAAKRLSQGVLF
jgi:hypothetical protein